MRYAFIGKTPGVTIIVPNLYGSGIPGSVATDESDGGAELSEYQARQIQAAGFKLTKLSGDKVEPAGEVDPAASARSAKNRQNEAVAAGRIRENRLAAEQHAATLTVPAAPVTKKK